MTATLRRFLCPRCGAGLTPWLRPLGLSEAVARYESRTSLVPRGWFARVGAPELAGAVGPAWPAYPWLLAPLPPRWLRPHPELRRRIGCCGMSYIDADHPNLVCACGHAVGIGYLDCCNPQWYALHASVGVAEIADPAPPQALAWRLTQARAVVAAPPVATTACSVGVSDVSHVDASTWAGAPRLRELELTCSGGVADPALTIASPELPAGAALVVSLPWVQVVRAVVLGETPWGDPEAPLSWQSAYRDAPIVRLSGRRKVVLMTVWGPGTQVSAVRLGARAWAGAWAGLRDAVASA